MRYNIINVNADKKQTFTNRNAFFDATDELISQGYKKLTLLVRKSCVNAYYYKEREE